jgi:hypothetical protein
MLYDKSGKNISHQLYYDQEEISLKKTLDTHKKIRNKYQNISHKNELCTTVHHAQKSETTKNVFENTVCSLLSRQHNSTNLVVMQTCA